jgi:predicted transcriptional regulator
MPKMFWQYLKGEKMSEVQKTVKMPEALEKKIQAMADKNNRTFSGEARVALEAHAQKK